MSRVLVIALATVLVTSPIPARAAHDAQMAAQRTLVLDGSAVLDVGAVHLNVTNWGLIGSRPGTGADFATAPSLEFPAGSGVDHLFAAGLWVGGLVDSVARVSTGQYQTELLADPEDPLDTIYASRENRKHSRRYPMPNADDDRDGVEDEDPIDGRDNDGDGLVDEDHAAIGDQYLRAVMRDDTQLAQDIFPDHEPLGIEVVQESFQWEDERFQKFVGFRFTITNRGETTIGAPYMGMFADFDIGNAANDLARYYDSAAMAYDGSMVDIQLARVHSAGAGEGAYAGVVLAGTNQVASSFQVYTGNAPFSQGGDPTNDAQRYLSLSSGEFDTGNGQANDVRVLLAVGPFEDLAPGESAVVDLAFVVGETLDALVQNAANAVRLAHGVFLDRDGDPSNGKEFHVPWIEAKGRAKDKPHGRGRLALKASPNPFNPRVEFSFDLPTAGATRIDVFDTRGRRVATVLDRQLDAGPAEIVWDGSDATGRAVSSGVYFVQLRHDQVTETIRAVVVR